MKRIKVKQLGVISLGEEVHAVLVPDANNLDLPAKPMHASVMYGEVRVVNVLVAREFFVERIEEGVVVSGHKMYASPHWVSLHGSFFIEWLPEITAIEVIVVGAGETLEDAE